MTQLIILHPGQPCSLCGCDDKRVHDSADQVQNAYADYSRIDHHVRMTAHMSVRYVACGSPEADVLHVMRA